MSKSGKKIKCIALTRKGRQCPNDALDGTNYCHINSHNPKKFIKKGNKLKWYEIIGLFVKKIFTSLWSVIVIISVMLAFYIFYPKVSVAPSSSLNLQNALMTPFIISNEGNMTIKEVTYLFEPYNVGADRGRGFVNGDSKRGGVKMTTNDIVPTLEPGEKKTMIFPPQIKFAFTIASVDMAIHVRFRLPFLPFIQWERVFRFITARDVNGVLNWYPMPRSQ